MISQNIIEQVRKIEANGATKADSDLMFIRLACIEKSLGLQSDDNLRTSDRFEAAITAINELSNLVGLQLSPNSNITEVKAFFAQQLVTIEKLEKLQKALAPEESFLGLFYGELDSTQQANFSTKILEQLMALPIQEIIAADSKLSNLFEAIEIPWKGRPQALFRLKSKPEVALPIWSQSKYSGGTRGAVLLQVKRPNELKVAWDKNNPDNGLVLEFRSLCACCNPAKYGVESPFLANKPDWSDKERLIDWENSTEGLAHKEWEITLRNDYAKALESTCTANGINTLILRRADTWISVNGNELLGIEMVEVTERDLVYQKLGFATTHKATSDKRFAVIE
jgi:hypothetical protein